MSGIPSSRRPATLASLAAELGVSRTTVSNAYNRPDQLSAPLRARVLEAARRLGYPGPDPVARSLRTRKAGAVGLLLTEALSYAFRDPVATGFLEGLALACEEAGQGLLLVPVSPEQEDVTAVHQAGVDGFVVYSVREDDPHFLAVLERPLPTVVCDQPHGVEGVDRVGVDDRAGMLALARHLAGLGHRRIGVLCMRLGTGHHDGPADLERPGLDSIGKVLQQLPAVTGSPLNLQDELQGCLPRSIFSNPCPAVCDRDLSLWTGREWDAYRKGFEEKQTASREIGPAPPAGSVRAMGGSREILPNEVSPRVQRPQHVLFGLASRRPATYGTYDSRAGAPLILVRSPSLSRFEAIERRAPRTGPRVGTSSPAERLDRISSRCASEWGSPIGCSWRWPETQLRAWLRSAQATCSDTSGSRSRSIHRALQLGPLWAPIASLCPG